MDTLGGFALIRGGAEAETDVNAPDDQHLFFGLDLSGGFRDQGFLRGRDSARFQRAGKSAGESTGCASHHVVDGGGVGRVGVRSDFVMAGDGAVDAEGDGLGFGGQKGFADGTAFALDTDFGAVNDFRHRFLL